MNLSLGGLQTLTGAGALLRARGYQIAPTELGCCSSSTGMTGHGRHRAATQLFMRSGKSVPGNAGTCTTLHINLGLTRGADSDSDMLFCRTNRHWFHAGSTDMASMLI